MIIIIFITNIYNIYIIFIAKQIRFKAVCLKNPVWLLFPSLCEMAKLIFN